MLKNVVNLTFQLEDGHTLFDYSVGLNDLVQIMVRQKVASPKKEPKPVTNGYNSSGEESVHSDKENEPVSRQYLTDCFT